MTRGALCRNRSTGRFVGEWKQVSVPVCGCSSAEVGPEASRRFRRCRLFLVPSVEEPIVSSRTSRGSLVSFPLSAVLLALFALTCFSGDSVIVLMTPSQPTGFGFDVIAPGPRTLHVTLQGNGVQ